MAAAVCIPPVGHENSGAFLIHDCPFLVTVACHRATDDVLTAGTIWAIRLGVQVQHWAIPNRERPMNFRLNTGFTVLAYTVVACYRTHTTLLRLWFLPAANAEELRSTAWTREINTHNVSTAPSRSVSSATAASPSSPYRLP